MSLPIKKRRFAHGSIAQFFSGDATASNSQNEGFVEGSIVRITMHNFLTYDHAEVFPGPKLNMIVGANGTGKSSVVCAICLGLAGKTSVVGRGDKVGVYVKRGCTKGSVEIELFRESGNLIITREIQSEHNQSTWMLNRKPCSQKAVEEAVKELHIQVGNLCQFLPQEKVGEFAKMSKVELLEATEKSVGPPEMFQIHCKLKSFRTTEREIENGCKERASFLEKAKQSNERNKVDVERYYLKKKHLDKIQMLEQKLPWVEYEASREELKGIKQEREVVKRNLRSLREAQEPLKKKISSVESQIQPIEKQIQEKTTRIREAMNECKKKSDQLETKNKEVDSITQGLILKQTEEADRKKRIDLTHLIIKDLQDELVKMGSLDDIMPEIETINAELRAIQEEKAKLDSASLDLRRDKDEATGESNRLQNQLRSLEDVMKIKEGNLRKRYGDTYTALLWLRQNHHRFEGKVHEPMMLVINVHDPRYAKYIESHIPINDLRAFVFEKKEDKELFMCEIRDTQKLRINTIIAPARSQSATAPMLPLESLKQYGIFSYLRELFDAPEEVMSYLCHQCRVHDVPVGTEKTKSLIERMAREVPLRVVYTAEERYSIKKSFYSGKTITSNSDVRASQFLSMTVNVEMRRQLQEQLQAAEQQRQNSDVQLQTLRERQAVLERRDNELRARKKQLSDQRSKKRQLEQKISAKQDSVRQMEQNVINLPAVEKKANAKIVAINKQKTVILEEHLSLIELKISTSMERVYLALESAGLMAEKTKLETDCKDNSAELTQAEQEFKRLEELKTTATATCRALLEKACKICKLSGSGGSPSPVLPAHLCRGFKELPNTLAEIEAMLNEEKARAECFTGLSAAVLEEYKQREKEILNIEKDLEDRMNKLTTYRQDISSAKERWLNPLKNLVEQINERFSDFFRSMHCAGEVDLHTENEEEYDKYGIRIRVKFRSSMELHELTPYHQSGGERSVSTMLYLMSLQKLNRCPFRVVDEINQGMDPVNERRVFDIVVKAACGGNTSQYFFITPKLLQNLQYDEQMTILFVHNGPHMLPSNQWKESAFLRRVKNRT